MADANTRKIAEDIREIRAQLSPTSGALNDDEVARFQAQADQNAERLRWAPVIGNGTAIIALAGIIGNVPSPDTALSALTWPLAAFSLGLALGVGSLFMTGELLALLATGPAENDQCKMKLLELVNEATSLTEGLTVENSVERSAAIRALIPRAKEIGARHRKLDQRLKRAKWGPAVASNLNGAALGMLVGGFTYLLVGHSTGLLRLEKPSELARPIASGARR